MAGLNIIVCVKENSERQHNTPPAGRYTKVRSFFLQRVENFIILFAQKILFIFFLEYFIPFNL